MRSGFDDFLASRKRVGEFHSSGSFTLSLDKSALEKLANYQFDFECAWIVKLVQAAVAKGEAAEVCVDLSRFGVEIEFESRWELDNVEAALLGGFNETGHGLDHLITALRLLAFKEKRPFLLSLPGQASCLAWTGEDLIRTDKDEERSERFHLSIELAKSFTDPARLKIAETRANISQALNKYCFVSPIPVLLDNLRVNGLFQKPSASEESLLLNSKVRLPLKGGFKSADLPSWRCPGETQAYSNTLPPLGKCSAEYVLTLFNHQEVQRARTQAKLAFEVCSDLNIVGFRGGARLRKTRLHWVKDGVVCQIDELPMEPNGILVNLYCSAEGLSHDISGLKLRDSEQYKARYWTVVENGLEVLEDVELYLGFSDRLRNEVESAYTAMGILGAAASFFLPVPLLVKPAFMLASGILGFRAGRPEKVSLPDLDPSLKKLREDWRNHLEFESARPDPTALSS